MKLTSTLGLLMVVAGLILLMLAGPVQAQSPAVPPIPHSTEDQTDCQACHSEGGAGAPRNPEDHAGRSNESCQLCHKVDLSASTVASARDEASLTPADYQGPDYCAPCHAAQYEQWKGTLHAQAAVDPKFQEEWLKSRKQAYCLACHTTGYDANTTKFVFEGVTCESCHGAYKEGHPPAVMEVKEEAELCGSCHTGVHSPTYEEWLVSSHARGNVECANCHLGHSLDLRAENLSELCGTCHHQAYEGSVHSIEGLTCNGCHMYTGLERTEFRSTGHTFEIAPEVCAGCHGMIHSKREPNLEASVQETLQEQVLVLQRQVAQLQESASNNLGMGLTVGIVGGLPLGFGAAWIIKKRGAKK